MQTCSPRVRFQEELQVHPKCQEYHDNGLRATDAQGQHAMSDGEERLRFLILILVIWIHEDVY